MEIKLNAKDNIRVKTNYSDNIFIDVDSGKEEMFLGVTSLISNQYVEVRKKDNLIKIFYFKKKSHKKYSELGWWDDAEVIFSNNNVVI